MKENAGNCLEIIEGIAAQSESQEVCRGEKERGSKPIFWENYESVPTKAEEKRSPSRDDGEEKTQS